MTSNSYTENISLSKTKVLFEIPDWAIVHFIEYKTKKFWIAHRCLLASKDHMFEWVHSDGNVYYQQHDYLRATYPRDLDFRCYRCLTIIPKEIQTIFLLLASDA